VALVTNTVASEDANNVDKADKSAIVDFVNGKLRAAIANLSPILYFGRF